MAFATRTVFSPLALALLLSLGACDTRSQDQDNANPEQALAAEGAKSEGAEFRHSKLPPKADASLGQRLPRDVERDIRRYPWDQRGRRRRPRRRVPKPLRCEYSGNSDQVRFGHISVGVLNSESDPTSVEIFAGERVSIEIENRGGVELRDGTFKAIFALPEELAARFEPPDGDTRPLPPGGFGWGHVVRPPSQLTQDADPFIQSWYDGVLFKTLRGHKSISVTPRVESTCDSRFPYDARLAYLSLDWNITCRAGKFQTDSAFTVKLVARRGKDSTRLLREVSLAPCDSASLTEPAPDGTAFKRRASFGIGTPPRGPAVFWMANGSASGY